MNQPPNATIEPRRRRASALWVIPVLAALGLAAFMTLQVRSERGPTVRIAFEDASGVEAGADLIHRGVRVGVTRRVELSRDLGSVVVIAELAPHAAGLAVEGTRFWIVRPELSLKRVEGLETLLGPRYIAVAPPIGAGVADAEPKRSFDGLPEAPRDLGGGTFLVHLHASTAGSISPGSAVLYRGVPIGRVRRMRLSDDATSVVIDAAIEEPYTRLVRENSRFWDASGVGVDFGWFRGLSLDTGSLDSVLTGAIAMATPTKAGAAAGSGTSFQLAPAPDRDWLEWSPRIPLVAERAP
ncbi:MAG: hypothetical protein CMJ31_13945 [Phycisphaerae bacterium]|nr:hypothetical protein [Phycisphaerae bacterium]